MSVHMCPFSLVINASCIVSKIESPPHVTLAHYLLRICRRNCMRESHAPCSCELWEKWKDVVITNMSGKTKSTHAPS